MCRACPPLLRKFPNSRHASKLLPFWETPWFEFNQCRSLDSTCLLCVSFVFKTLATESSFVNELPNWVKGSTHMTTSCNQTALFIQPLVARSRPQTENSFADIFANFRAKFAFVIEKGDPIPESLILLLEHSDHYSLQTSVKCTHDEFNKHLTDFVLSKKVISKDEFFSTYYNSTNEWIIFQGLPHAFGHPSKH